MTWILGQMQRLVVTSFLFVAVGCGGGSSDKKGDNQAGASGLAGGSGAAGEEPSTGGKAKGGSGGKGSEGEGGHSDAGESSGGEASGGTAGAGGSPSKVKTLSDYLPCKQDSDCPVGFGDCVTEIPFSVKDPSGETKVKLSDLFPDMPSKGLCTKPCTNTPESCSSLSLKNGKGESVPYSCQLVAVGESPYPKSIKSYPVTVSASAMSDGAAFGAICRPPFGLDSKIPDSICKACSADSDCDDGVCFDLAHGRVGSGDAPGVCLMACSKSIKCPQGFLCSETTNEKGDSLGDFCQPIQKTCGACRDDDGDGRGTGQCGEGKELITPVDCDDQNPDAYYDPEHMDHAFPASCGEQDYNCNGLSDAAEQLALPETWGYANCGACGSACTGAVTHGVAQCSESNDEITCGSLCSEGWADCTDEPGCETAVDDPSQLYYPDQDGDGFGEEGAPGQFACGGKKPEGTVQNQADCSDADPEVNPEVTEVCDGVDNDCDGSIDEADATDAKTWYRDRDGDGFGDPETTLRSCEPPSSYVDNDEDCTDFDAGRNPGLTDVDCDGIDQDCSGIADDGYQPVAGCNPQDSAYFWVCSSARTTCECLPSAVEDIPGDGADTNCDGFDGDIEDSIFVEPGVAAATDCVEEQGTSPDNPCRNLQAAIDRAAEEGKMVIAAEGLYVTPVAIVFKNGVSVYGGFDLTQGILGGETIFRREGAGHRVVAYANQIGADTLLWNLTLEAVTPNGSGLGTYGLACDGCTSLVLDNVTVSLGNGSDGATGSTGDIGGSGGAQFAKGGDGGGSNGSGTAGTSLVADSGGTAGAAKTGGGGGYGQSVGDTTHLLRSTFEGIELLVALPGDGGGGGGQAGGLSVGLVLFNSSGIRLSAVTIALGAGGTGGKGGNGGKIASNTSGEGGGGGGAGGTGGSVFFLVVDENTYDRLDTAMLASLGSPEGAGDGGAGGEGGNVNAGTLLQPNEPQVGRNGETGAKGMACLVHVVDSTGKAGRCLE